MDKGYRCNFEVLENGVLRLIVEKINYKEKPLITITKDVKVIASYQLESQSALKTYPIVEGHYHLLIDGKKNQFKVYDLINERYVLSSEENFFRVVDDKQKGICLKIKEDEKIVGLGQEIEGALYIKDIERRCWNEWNGYDYLGSNTVPFYMTNKGYGLYVDSTYPLRFVFGEGNIQPEPIAHSVMAETPFDWNTKACPNNNDAVSIISWEEERMVYYIMLGDMKEVSRKYYQLTGTPSILPKWALGYIQCKNRYKSEQEILHIAKKMRDKKIPCDTIVIDWLWFKEFGDLYWDGKYFTERMKETIKILKEMNLKILLAVHPFVDRSSKNYKDLNEKGCLSNVPDNGRPFFDHTHPDTKEEMWKFYQKLFDEGVAGWWTDMGEPESDLLGTTCYGGHREKYHNVYTLLWSKNIYNAQKEHTGTRNFCLARTNALGIQNYNTAYWTGDVFATWEIYRRNVKATQTVSISGQPYVCSDIGGFHTDYRFTPELYIRWLQWGVFSGLFRVHGVKPENEPWSLGNENQEILRECIELRYSLIPYIYSYVYKMNTQGVQLVRPMVFDYPNDHKACRYEYQYMFGKLLVAPVVMPDQRMKEVYLPEGCWYNYYTGEEFRGNREINFFAPINRLPLLAKEGSIIVTTEPTEYVKDIYDNYIITVFGNRKCQEILYEDDGTTYDFEKGHYNLIKFIFNNGTIKIYTEHFNYKTEFQQRQLVLRWYNENKLYETTVQYNIGEELVLDLKQLPSRNIKQEGDLKIAVDVTHSEYNGNYYMNLAIKNQSGCMKNLKIELEKPQNYYVEAAIDLPEALDFSSQVKVEESAQYLFKKVQIDQSYSYQFPFKPFKMKMPQLERINLRVWDIDTEQVVFEDVITIGNGYVKNWKYAVSKYENIDEENLNYAPYRDSNPWGYIYLYQYLNMQENGICPVDFIEIIQKIGFGYAVVTIESPEDKKAILRIRADESAKFLLNGTEIYSNSHYTVEEDIAVELNKGKNLLQVYLKWKSPRPFTGREFGLSAQVLTIEKDIDDKVKCY